MKTKTKFAKEFKIWFNNLRRRDGKKNGVIKTFLLDNPNMERKLANSKKLKKHIDKSKNRY